MKFKLRYLPLFEEDLLGIVKYISGELQNNEAADKFINKLEAAIIQRSQCLLAFEPYPSKPYRVHPYYRIYVGNFTAYYVVIDDIMEMRRLLYSPRNNDELL